VIPEVREILLGLQRRQAREPGLVADGRDMGTVVFPSACLKIYMTASAEIRLERRHKQLREKNFDVNLPQLRLEMAERDKRDASRKSSPMAAAPDATTVDTSNLDINEVLAKIRLLLTERLKS
jgi:cytidylate kinase